MIKGNMRQKRTANLEVRYGEVVLKRPKRKATQGLAKSFTTHFIQITEYQSSVPEGEKPISWQLFTNIAINTEKLVRKVIHIYVLRWLIEELFRILKTKGLRIEEGSFRKF